MIWKKFEERKWQVDLGEVKASLVDTESSTTSKAAHGDHVSKSQNLINLMKIFFNLLRKKRP